MVDRQPEQSGPDRGEERRRIKSLLDQVEINNARLKEIIAELPVLIEAQQELIRATCRVLNIFRRQRA
jgi:hypothetical protein